MSTSKLSTAGALLACLVLVGWFWVRGNKFIAANGPTFDENAHLVAGYGYWTEGRFRLNPEHPPLLKLLWATPLLFTDAPPFPSEVANQTNENHWRIANAWIHASGADARELLATARRMNLALGCGLVALVGWIAFRVWNSQLAGVMGCAFAAADPTLLALSCVLTTDLGLTLFTLLTCYLLWEYVAHPTRGLLIACGVSLGLALGAKFSVLALVVGLVVAALIYVYRGGILTLPGADGKGFRPAFDFTFRVAVVAIIVLGITYAFLHFPEWARGLKFQLTRGSHGDGVAYLNGALSREGWFHYPLVALGLKLPLGLLLAASVSAVSLIASRKFPNRAVWLIVPPLVFFALVSLSRVNLGVRVVYPCVPFLYLLAAGLAVPTCCRVTRGFLLGVCLAWCVLASQRINPYELSHFNEVAGGPGGGPKYLADSNVDWGQGLPALKQWMDANDVEVIYLGYFGTDRPEAHGIRFHSLPGYGRVGEPGGETIPTDAKKHIVAVSVNHLLGMFLDDPNTYAWLRDRSPIAVVAHCIYIFDLTGDPEAIARLRALSP